MTRKTTITNKQTNNSDKQTKLKPNAKQTNNHGKQKTIGVGFVVAVVVGFVSCLVAVVVDMTKQTNNKTNNHDKQQ